MLKINSVRAVGAQVAPGRVVVAHCAEDHEQLAHAGSERANTRVGQAPATDVVTTGREMLAAHGHHRLRSPHARPSQRRAPFPTFRHSCILRPLRPLRHSCGGRNPGDLCGSRALPMFDGARSPAGPGPSFARLGGSPPSFRARDAGGARSPSTPKSARSTTPQRRAPFPPFPPASFLRRQESRRSVRVKGTPNVRRRPITRGALVGRRPDGGSSHGWAVAWIPASAGMTDRAGVMEGAEE